MTEKEFKDLEKEFCDCETSVALKELGFREKCLTYYDTEDNVGLLFNTQWTVDVMPCQFTDCLESHNSNTSDDNSYVDAPTIYQVQKWLRKEKCIHVLPELGLIYRNKNGLITHYYRVLIKNMNSGIIITLDNDRDDFESYEEALSEGIKNAIEILKQLV